VSTRPLLAALASLAACGGSAAAPGAATPANTPEGTVSAFMQAVADSNLTKMAGLWGTAQGSAAKTGQPPDYQRRIIVIQSYLRGPYRVLGDAGAAALARGADSAGAADTTNVREVSVELDRGQCKRVVPFRLVATSDRRWIINQIDLAAAGSVFKPCEERKDTTR
jgi:hypothetical protein